MFENYVLRLKIFTILIFLLISINEKKLMFILNNLQATRILGDYYAIYKYEIKIIVTNI